MPAPHPIPPVEVTCQVPFSVAVVMPLTSAVVTVALTTVAQFEPGSGAMVALNVPLAEIVAEKVRWLPKTGASWPWTDPLAMLRRTGWGPIDDPAAIVPI